MAGIERPITYMAIDAYARRHGIEGEAFDRLLRFVHAIDMAYLDAAHRAQSKPPSTTSPQDSYG